MAHDDLVFYVQLRVKHDRIDAWRRAVDEIVKRMSAEDSFVACYLHRDAQNACLFTLYERWREPSVAAFLANQDKPYRRDYEAKLLDLLQKPRDAALLKPLGEWHKE